MVPRAPQEGGGGTARRAGAEGAVGAGGRGVEGARVRNLEPGPATPPCPSLPSLTISKLFPPVLKVPSIPYHQCPPVLLVLEQPAHLVWTQVALFFS